MRWFFDRQLARRSTASDTCRVARDAGARFLRQRLGALDAGNVEALIGRDRRRDCRRPYFQQRPGGAFRGGGNGLEAGASARPGASPGPPLPWRLVHQHQPRGGGRRRVPPSASGLWRSIAILRTPMRKSASRSTLWVAAVKPTRMSTRRSASLLGYERPPLDGVRGQRQAAARRRRGGGRLVSLSAGNQPWNLAATRFFLAATLGLLAWFDEARAAAQAGLALDPVFTIARFRSGASSDNSVYLRQCERIYDGMRKAGMPEVCTALERPPRIEHLMTRASCSCVEWCATVDEDGQYGGSPWRYDAEACSSPQSS